MLLEGPTATNPHWNIVTKASEHTFLNIGFSTVLLPVHTFEFMVLFSIEHQCALQKIQVTICNYSASNEKRPNHTFYSNAWTDCQCGNIKLSIYLLVCVFITSINTILLNYPSICLECCLFSP